MSVSKPALTPEQYAQWVKRVVDAIESTVFPVFSVEKVGDVLAILAYLAGWTLVEVEDEGRAAVLNQFIKAVSEQAERAAAKIRSEYPDGTPTKH